MQILRELYQFSSHHLNLCQPFRKLQRILQGVRKASVHPFPDHKTIYDNLYAVLDVLIKLNFLLSEVIRIPVHTNAYITCSSCSFQDLS